MNDDMWGLSRRAALAILSVGGAASLLSCSAYAQKDSDPNSMVVEGVLAYLGILPASIVQGHPSSHPEAGMHGGSSEARHRYHLVLALFDAASGNRIESAQVSVIVSGLGHVGTTKTTLDPMLIADTVTWGTFVSLPGQDLYDLTFEVVLPERPGAIVFPFRYSHTAG